jgi:hypothetical protein
MIHKDFRIAASSKLALSLIEQLYRGNEYLGCAQFVSAYKSSQQKVIHNRVRAVLERPAGNAATSTFTSASAEEVA